MFNITVMIIDNRQGMQGLMTSVALFHGLCSGRWQPVLREDLHFANNGADIYHGEGLEYLVFERSAIGE